MSFSDIQDDACKNIGCSGKRCSCVDVWIRFLNTCYDISDGGRSSNTEFCCNTCILIIISITLKDLISYFFFDILNASAQAKTIQCALASN